jgi:hypothetical protein
MIRFDDLPWRQPCPLPPADERSAASPLSPVEASPPAIGPGEADCHPMPLALPEDDHRWMILL